MMQLARSLKHCLTWPASVKRRFPDSCLAAMSAAIGASETSHLGEIRFAIEPALQLQQLWRGMTPRERAMELFSQLRVWDTEHNSGVLVYVLMADRAIEIVADRGIHAQVGASEWEAIAEAMRAQFALGHYADGALAAIAEITRLLRAVLPAHGPRADELPNDVALV